MDSRDDDKQQAGFGSPRDDQNLLLEGLERQVQELERQREQFQTMLCSIGDGVIATDTRGRITFLNPIAEKFTGWQFDEASGRDLETVFNIINEHTRQSATQPVRRVLRSGVSVGLANHTALVSRDGTEISIEDSAAPIKDAGGVISGAVMVFHDVTERRRIDELQARLAAIVEHSDDGIIGKTLDGIVTSWNNGAERIFGYCAAEMIGQPITKLIPAQRHAEEAFILDQLRHGESVEHYESVRVTKDGRYINVSLTSSPIRNAQGDIIGASKILRDITERKQAEEERARLTGVLEKSLNEIFMFDTETLRFQYVNHGALRNLGYSLEAMRAMTPLDLKPEFTEAAFRAMVRPLLQGEQEKHVFRTLHRRRDGTDYPVEVHLQLAAHGEKRIFLAIILDITERAKTEEALRCREAELQALAEERKEFLDSERAARSEAERAGRLKDAFLANLSHELRTPLSAILGWSQVLRRPDADMPRMQKGLEAIERSARMQLQLIEDLLDMSRIVSGKVRLDVQPVEALSCVEAAVETVRPAAEAKGIRLLKVLDPDAGQISGDPGRLQQVVWNLLTNAVKFTPKGGQVQVVLERVNSHIEISVADSGIGIRPEFLPHLFQRFRQEDGSTTRTHGGLGIGLSIVKHLVELHGGTVCANSDGEGCGSTFTVSLPLTVVIRNPYDGQRFHPQATQPVAIDFDMADLSGIRILVVDDEPDARELVERVLSDCGAQVLIAGSAAEALLLVESEKPHVLVSDIGMPEVDGYELLRRVRSLDGARGGKLPAIALTAYARSEDRTRALRAGFLIHLAKPVEPAELIATIASVAGRAGEADA